MRLALALAFALALVPACKKAAEVDCGMAAKAWAELVGRQLDADGDADRRAKAMAVVPALREALVTRCRDDQWPAATRRCMTDAHSPADLERCDPRAAAPAPAAK